MKLLIIEDNQILRTNIATYFELQDWSVDTHDSYTGASYKIITGNYDVIILDLGLWEWEHDGIEICSELRNKANRTPILMLTARNLTQQKIDWLSVGADDYLTKPFDYGELLARVQSLNRREKQYKWNILEYKNIAIYKESLEVKKDGNIIKLSKREYDLLIYLLENTGRVLKKDQILETVWWDIDMLKNSRKLDLYISYLRKKVSGDLIETIHGVWYMIQK